MSALNIVILAAGKGTRMYSEKPKVLHALAGNTLVLYGDVPLIQLGTLHRMLQAGDGLVLLTVDLDNPAGYGRIVRNEQGDVLGIVEEKDASPGQREIREVNTGILLAPTGKLREWLANLQNNNSQGEYYLTDIVGMAVQQGIAVHTVQPAHEWEIHGINSKAQLAALERVWQQVEAHRLLAHGVTLGDPARIGVA